MKRVLGPVNFRQMLWANGKGVTVEMAREDLDGRMLWRLSRASVVENGPFSIFPDVERNLTVLTGPGFRLTGDGVDLDARPMAPVAFAGDVAVMATGVTAPSDDFNVMTARHLQRPRVAVVEDGAALSPDGALLAVYTPKTERLVLADEAITVSGGPAIAVWLFRS